MEINEQTIQRILAIEIRNTKPFIAVIISSLDSTMTRCMSFGEREAATSIEESIMLLYDAQEKLGKAIIVLAEKAYKE